MNGAKRGKHTQKLGTSERTSARHGGAQTGGRSHEAAALWFLQAKSATKYGLLTVKDGLV
jgi:hypothetical protein